MRIIPNLQPSLIATVIAISALTTSIPLATLRAQAPTDSAVTSQAINAIRWRQIGPANMMGRIVDVEGIPSPSKTFYFVSAAGGVFKTTNSGTTFRAVLDSARVAAGGDMAIAPSDTNVLYVGTGEPNTRNSISPGGGIYKSTDGGKSWTFLGLAETRAIARIQVHPTDPNTVWVAALGHPWGPNKERGMYKTTDGGKSWRLVKFIDDKTGFVDVQLDPRNPDIVWASSYQRVRGPYFLDSGGPGSALWKSTDGGETWAEVTGGGFPTTTKGRIGIAISASSPDVMYTLVEADTAPNAKPADPKAAPAKRPSGLYRSEDAGKTWAYMSPENTRPFYYNQVRVDPKDPNRVYWSSTPVKYSSDGGKTAGNTTQGIHVDHHAMWIDPNDPQRIIVGDDGGVAMSFDRGGNWNFLNTVALGQFYNISADMGVPYRVCGGLQDNGSWCGPSRRKQGPITNAMWHNVGGGDGFVTQQDQTDTNIIYSESQGGSMGRLNFATGQRTGLRKPTWRDGYSQWDDSIYSAWPDDSKPASTAAKQRIATFRARQKADSMANALRWNWNTPYIISKHNSATLYFGANRVLKSVKYGDEMFPISGELSYADTVKLNVALKTTGGVTPDVTGAETFGTVVSLNESPMRPGLLYAGTDDGRVWMTRNDGANWEELTSRFPGVPAGSYVSRIEPSHFDSSTFYVTFDNHRRDDYQPYVFATNDFGKSFTSIVNHLPSGQVDFVHVIREDTKNRDLLFVGTDVGAYVSLNRGESWQRFMTGLPSTPVHDLLIHPRDGELIAGTHGRSIWIADITALQQMTPEARFAKAMLFEPRVAFQWGESTINGGNSGHSVFEAPSPQYGATIWYRLGEAVTGPVRVVIQDAAGDTLRTITGNGGRGMHNVIWDFRATREAPVVALTPAQKRDSIKTATRVNKVIDSLVAAGVIVGPMVATVREMVRTGTPPAALLGQFGGGFGGGGGGGGGRGGAGAGGFDERPGESSPRPSFTQAAATQGRAAGAAESGRDALGANGLQTILGDLREALGDDFAALGFGGRGGGRGRNTNSLVGTGDYRITLVAGSTTMSQLLHVERISGDDGGGFGFGEDEELDRPLPGARR